MRIGKFMKDSIEQNKREEVKAMSSIIIGVLLLVVGFSIYGLLTGSMLIVVFCGFTNLALVKLMLG